MGRSPSLRWLPVAALLLAGCARGGPRPDGSGPTGGPCEAGRAACDGAHALACGADGLQVRTFCDPTQGMRCDPSLGRCVGECATVGRSYVGCEYLATVTPNMVATQFPFAVAVANPGSTLATVWIEGGASARPLRFEVGGGQVHVERLPWVEDLKVCLQPRGITCSQRFVSSLARRGAYRLRSSAPVIVYQFSPLGYGDDRDGYTYSNDASILVPTSALSTDYVVPGWPARTFTSEQGAGRTAAALTVTAAEDDTEVTVIPTAPIAEGLPDGPSAAGAPVTAHLMRGDVLQLLTTDGDLTGSRVTATRPVMVVSAHLCANVPLDTPYCDHLEEVVFPRDTLSTEYAVVPPAVAGCDPRAPSCAARSAARILALSDDVTLAYDPPQALPDRLFRAGDVIDLEHVAEPFVVRSDGRILVTQLMHGQCSGVPGDTAECELAAHGDPSMVLSVPTDQFRQSYLFHAPTSYESLFATVVGPVDAAIELDGRPLGALVPIGGSGLGWTRVALSGDADGNHRLSAAARVGVDVYGYGRFTSFWYPGGFDLEPVVLE